MSRHRTYSKRSRESRKAMCDGSVECAGYLDVDDRGGEDWQADADESDPPQDSEG